MPGLAARLGMAPEHLLVLREDLLGPAAGGNKVRKAAAALSRAAEQGVEHVITTGAPQSNHARATAILGARFGLQVTLVLQGAAPARRTGNLLLEELAGATIEWAGTGEPAAIADQIRAASPRSTRVIPFGGSDPDACHVYAQVGAQLDAALPDLRHVVVAVGSGATAAGLVIGLGADRVLAVDTGAVPDARTTVTDLVQRARPDVQQNPAALRMDGTQIGDGYADIPAAVIDAVRHALADDGILFDVTYAGRALAGLVHGVRSGELPKDERMMLIHSGGAPGLFGHPDLT